MKKLMWRRIVIGIFCAIIFCAYSLPVFANDAENDMNQQELRLSLYSGLISVPSCYGLSAKITAPSSFPYVGGSGESAWVSTNQDASGQWAQAGLRYYNGYSTLKTYVEYFIGGVYTINEIGMHLLGVSIPYKVEYVLSSGGWGTFIGNTMVAVSVLLTNNIGLQAHGESHASTVQLGPFTFSDVKRLISNTVWTPATGTLHADNPYHVTGTASNFTVYGP